jgi:EARP and GARP complex-interacting protein 1
LISDTKDYGTDVLAVDFHPTIADTIACVLDKKIVLFDINKTDEVKQDITVKNKLSGGMWNGANQFVTIQERNIVAFDTRETNSTTSAAWEIEDADSQMVRDIDVNPNKAFHIVCGGDDGVIKIFDTRKNREPVFSTGGIHKHWIFSVSFNKFHDQLLLSSSSDGKVALTRALSCSSEAEAALNVSDVSNIDDDKSIQNGVLKIFSSEHDDSVYLCEWSFFDPWAFASLSYDGRLIISRVPKEHKYQIIL